MDQAQFTPDFILQGQILLQKSVESDKAVQAGTAERRLIYGEITNSNPDEEDERLISKALDFSYFDEQGFIKYEHVANDPTHIIGAPHERITTPEGGTLIKGALFSNTKYADATWKLIQSLEEHNRLYPEHQKTLGWSIEGQYTDNQIEKGGFRKAKVVNVVITPNPVNKSVYLHALAENHAIFAKSLNADKAMAATPANTDLANKTGIDAIAKENIDEEIKETAEEIEPGSSEDVKKKKEKLKLSKSEKRSSLMQFETLEKAISHFTELGEEKETATRLAKSFFTEEELAAQAAVDEGTDQELGQEVNALSKAIGDLGTGISKLLNLNKSKVGDTAGADADLGADEFETVHDDADGDFINVGDTMLYLQKGMENLTELVSEMARYGVERDTQMAKALDGIGVLKADLNKSITAVQESVTVGEGDKAVSLSKAVEILLKSRSGANVDLSNLQIAHEGQETTSAQAGEPIGWGEMQAKLEKGMANKVITSRQATAAEAAHRTKEWDEVRKITNLVTD